MYNKPLTIAATTILLCSPVIILSSCEKKDAGAGNRRLSFLTCR